MPSEVDICNLALSHLGDSATIASIDPPEGSAQAEHCAVFYPLARDTLQELHNWSFITRRASLALLSAESFNYRFAYAVPNNCIRVLSVLEPTSCMLDPTAAFVIEADENGSRIVLTDVESAVLRYTMQITDPTKFPPLFVDALAWLLASHLAGPVIKGDSGAAAARSASSAFQTQFKLAAVSDANQRKIEPRGDGRDTPWIESRVGFGARGRWSR